MSEFVVHMLDLVSRYVHIVSTTILVGGTLFYEWVMPAAIDELKREHQLDVFGRARWFFRNVVWISAVLLVLSGIVVTRKYWMAYAGPEMPPSWRAPGSVMDVIQRPGWWFVAHASTGLIAVIIAIYLTTTRRPPENPVGWMRINVVILLIVIFLASATQHMRHVAQGIRRGEVSVPFVTPD